MIHSEKVIVNGKGQEYHPNAQKPRGMTCVHQWDGRGKDSFTSRQGVTDKYKRFVGFDSSLLINGDIVERQRSLGKRHDTSVSVGGFEQILYEVHVV